MNPPADSAKTRRCAICDTWKPVADFNREHVIPEALGGCLICHDVCRDCNSTAGSTVDARLSAHPLLRLACLAHKIAGKDGTVPNPFRRCQPTAAADGTAVRLRIDQESGAIRPEVETRVTKSPVVRPDGVPGTRYHIVTDAKQADELTNIANTIRRRANEPEFTDDQVQELTRRGSIGPIHIDLSIPTTAFAPGLLKSAYLLALGWLGPTYLDDPMAARIRSVLSRRDPQPEDMGQALILGEFRLMNPEEQQSLMEAESPPHQHVACIVPSSTQTVVTLHLFHVLTAQVVVSEDPGRYALRTIRQILLDPVQGTAHEIGVDLPENGVRLV